MMKNRFSRHWFEIGLILLSLIVHLYIASRPASTLMNWYSSDDGFYYFKVAANVTSGLGVTFDGISRTNGFQPLWLLVCIPVFSLARIDLMLPLRLLVLISGMLNAGTGILIFRLMRRVISPGTSAAVSVIWVFLPAIHAVVTQTGMESTISAFFLVLLIFLAVKRREEPFTFWKCLPIGIVAGLAILARLDNIFVAMLIGVWFILGKVSDYLRTIIVGDLALIFIVGLLGYFFRLPAGPLYIANSGSMPLHIALGFILIPISMLLFGLYRPSAERLSWGFLLRCVLAVGMASAVTGLCLIISQKAGLITALPRSVILINFAGILICVVGVRLLAGVILRGDAASGKSPFLSLSFWKTILPGALGYFVAAVVLLGSYMLWSFIYVGTSMPVSGQIKHWWGDLPNTAYGSVHRTLSEVFGFTGRAAWDLAQSPLHFLENTAAGLLQSRLAITVGRILDFLMILLVLGVIFLQRKRLLTFGKNLGLLPVFLGLYAQILSYTTTSYIPIRNWYWVGEMVFTVILLGVFLEGVFMSLNHAKIKPLVWQAGMAILSLIVLVFFGAMVSKNFPYSVSPDNQDAFLSDVHALETSTEPGALIGQTGGGTTAYFIKDRIIVNLDGLISSPEYFHLLRKGQGAQYLDRIGLDYVNGSEMMLTASDPYSQLLKGHLAPVSQIGTGILYRYIP